jgi:hypothetical protein
MARYVPRDADHRGVARLISPGRPGRRLEKIGVNQVQVPRGRRDVGMSHQTLDDMDVLAPAHEARGIGMPASMRKVPTGHAR